MNKYDDETIKEFYEHFKNIPIPNPENYPIQFKFLVDSFIYYKNRREVKNET